MRTRSDAVLIIQLCRLEPGYVVSILTLTIPSKDSDNITINKDCLKLHCDQKCTKKLLYDNGRIYSGCKELLMEVYHQRKL